ncbi:MAG: hypothetical protein IPM64_13130 [Phycisphaerales bacterium]|nr:hypothetical protein [Phycisphaerales bacterium]
MALAALWLGSELWGPAFAEESRSPVFSEALLDAILLRDGLSGYSNWTGRRVAYEVLFDSRVMLDNLEAQRVERFVRRSLHPIAPDSVPASQPDGAALDIRVLFRRVCKASPAVAAEVYDRTLKRALICHFVERDFAQAIELYALASDMAADVVPVAKEVDMLLLRARSPSSRVWFSALSREGSAAEHCSDLGRLTRLAEQNSTEWQRPANEARAIEGHFRRGAPRYEYDETSRLLLDVWVQEVIEQALVADVWRGDRESESLYRLAGDLLQLQLRPQLEAMQRLAQRAGSTQPAREESDSIRVTFRGWQEPGFIAVFAATQASALRDAYFLQDAQRASVKLSILLQLSHGLHGSARLDAKDSIETARSRLAASGGGK